MWEEIESRNGTTSDRLWIPDGWIVRSRMITTGGNCATVQTVVHDENHTWELTRHHNG